MSYLIAFLVGFVCGSIPSGLVIVRLVCGIDIREYGSKNIGTTNVFRTVGARMALLVLLSDMLKGIGAVLLVRYFGVGGLLMEITAALGAVLGHNYSLFLGFKGGRGVATGLGVALLFLPDVTLLAFLLWLTIVLTTRYVSLGSIVAAFFTPIGAYVRGYSTPIICFIGAIAAFIIVRHYENIRRLLAGTESKIKPGSLQNVGKK